MAITLRSLKGSALTHAELDANFTTLRDVASQTSGVLSGLTSVGAGFFVPTTAGTNGLGLVGANNPGLYASSTKVIDWTSAAVNVAGTITSTTAAGSSNYLTITQPSGTAGKASGVRITNTTQDWFIGTDYSGGSRSTLEFYSVTGAASRMALTAAGALAVPGTLGVGANAAPASDVIGDFALTQTSTTSLRVKNASTGTGVYAQFLAESSAGSVALGQVGIGTAGTGAYEADYSYLVARSNSTGLNIGSDGGSIKFYAGGVAVGNLEMTLATTGLTIADDLAVNGGDLTTSASTMNLVNATATTVNFAGGASTALNMGHASGTTTLAGAQRMSFYGAGAATFDGSGNITSVSDERAKIKDGSITDPISKVMAMEPGYFYYNEGAVGPFGKGQRQLGLFYQNIRDALGDEAAPLPQFGKFGNYYPAAVLAVLVEAVKNHEVRLQLLGA